MLSRRVSKLLYGLFRFQIAAGRWQNTLPEYFLLSAYAVRTHAYIPIRIVRLEYSDLEFSERDRFYQEIVPDGDMCSGRDVQSIELEVEFSIDQFGQGTGSSDLTGISKNAVFGSIFKLEYVFLKTFQITHMGKRSNSSVFYIDAYMDSVALLQISSVHIIIFFGDGNIFSIGEFRSEEGFLFLDGGIRETRGIHASACGKRLGIRNRLLYLVGKIGARLSWGERIIRSGRVQDPEVSRLCRTWYLSLYRLQVVEFAVEESDLFVEREATGCGAGFGRLCSIFFLVHRSYLFDAVETNRSAGIETSRTHLEPDIFIKRFFGEENARIRCGGSIEDIQLSGIVGYDQVHLPVLIHIEEFHLHDGALDGGIFSDNFRRHPHEFAVPVFDDDKLPLVVDHDDVAIAISVEVARSFPSSSGIHHIEEVAEALVRPVIVLEEFDPSVVVEDHDILLPIVVVVDGRVGLDDPAFSR